MLAWNIITNILDKNILGSYSSAIDTALNVLYAPNEAYSVLIASNQFLNKVLDIFATEGDISMHATA